MYKYIVVEEHLEHPDIGTYTSYGIKAMRGTEAVEFVSDVSVDKTFVEALARCCTDLQLDPIHLFDVVEDAIQ